MPALVIIQRPIAGLRPFANNARTHSPEQIEQLAASISAFGFTNPVLITDDGQIVAGHGRVEAAKHLGLNTVPTLTVGSDWSPDQLRAYVLADNQLALNAGWDEELLAAELRELSEAGFNLDLVGFDADALGRLLDENAGADEAAQAAAAGGQAAATGEFAAARCNSALDPSKAVVMFSGGKDSLAAALALKAQGKRPALFYCRGINGAAYAREADSARATAAAAALPLRIVDVALEGKSAHIENPAKNLFLAGLGAEIALKHGAGIVALGALAHDGENARNFGCGLSDDPGLIAMAGQAIRAWAPGIEIIPALHGCDADSFARVWRDLPAAIPLIGSCMLGPRAHRMTREANERKFSIELMPGRCGSCYKCAFEMIAIAALEDRALPADLAKHCIEKLRKGLQIIRGSEKAPAAAEAIEAFFEPRVAGCDPRRALGAA